MALTQEQMDLLIAATAGGDGRGQANLGSLQAVLAAISLVIIDHESRIDVLETP